ncbi:30S ribosomal protein S17e [Candidatus Woesearchaeota archaeon]|nr:30S ribosomal protein S17e [Candidatus Woesearchaeota archaeon]
MGRIKTQQIKSKGEQVFELYGKEYTTNFDENKVLVEKHTTVRSKKLRNVLAGFMTRKTRQERAAK